jgi:hypothetical protein
MPAPVIPAKTALGQEELRRRTGGLGQRHRTILFLIDGKRPLSEVLSLAQKAGAATNHFEDLVRLGYVEMPPEEFAPTVPADALPAEEPPAELAELTHVELTVPAGDDDAPPPVPETVSEAVVLAPQAEPEPEPAPAAGVAPAPAVTPASAPAPAPEVARAPAPVAPPARAPAPAPLTIALPPSAPPVRTPVADAVEEFVDENEPLGKVRRCLLDALYMDPTPFGFRAAMRVRTARTTAALIEIVWEMERDMGLSMRSRSGLQNLQRARELLGLGNTLVDEDSQSPRPDDSTW